MSAQPIRRLSPVYTGKNAANSTRTKEGLKKNPNNSIPPLLSTKNLNRTQAATFSARKSLMTGSTNLRVRPLLKKTLKFLISILPIVDLKIIGPRAKLLCFFHSIISLIKSRIF
nr:TPA: ALTO [Baja California bark scorpion polyomavirus 1]